MKAELDVTKTVKKSNILNELRNANASLIEYRLFCVYLSHISMNSDDNVVKFSLSDYAKIAGLDRPRYLDLKAQAENLVGMTASLANGDGGFSVYSIFSEFKLFKENEQWMVSLECNSKIAPMIREQRGRFLRYKLYNTIYLRSYNQQRMYELLKQYEKIGARAIDLPDLRAFLSIRDDEYPVWGVFARDVLKVAQRALKENTDIYFEYEPVKKSRKVVGVRFDIFKNHEFIDQLRIDEFLLETDEGDYDGDELDVRAEDYDSVVQLEDGVEQLRMEIPEEDPRLEFFRTALTFPEKLNTRRMEALVTLLNSCSWAQSIPLGAVDAHSRDLALHGYLKLQDRYVLSQDVQHYFGYLRHAVTNNDAEVLEYQLPDESNGSFDTNDFFSAAINKNI